MDPTTDLERRIAGIAALDQPLRRELYRHLASTGGWLTRDEAAAALGVPRSVAAFHLDKLADAGIVEVGYQRTSGRQGPGAGRPSKLYRLSQDEIAASIPERHYDLAGSLLATAIAESTRTGTPVDDCLRIAARAAGHEIGEDAREAVQAAGRSERRQAIVDVLARHGYEPEASQGRGKGKGQGQGQGQGQEIALANCPFHRLAQQHRELVCGMNHDFLGGLLEGIGHTDRFTARLDPAPGYCCVRITAVDPATP